MSDSGDDLEPLRLLAGEIRQIKNQVQSLLPMKQDVSDIKDAIKDLDLKNVPPRRRKLFPDLMEWWADRGERQRDWKFYFPIALSFVGPILGGILVVWITHSK